MIAAIVLAAGMSTRMGALKQLLPFGASTVLGSVIGNLREAAVDRIVVVAGHEAEKVRRALEQAAATVEFVVNQEYRSGMFSSVQTGLQALPTGAETLLICLGDQPTIRGRTLRALIDAFAACGSSIGIPIADRDQGHPLLLDGKYRAELLAMAPTLTLKHFLSAHRPDIARLPVEDTAILRDIDTRSDYEDECRRLATESPGKRSAS